ncbi:NET1-associated nuclear protein 1 [Saxophila tyrrhenica]|uniref:NET1-associated nuclear protein 1 n=1 Tax=Saxophila tyrrhenica TaxID=1690608 RepID=A0AAV9PBY6_9PEZI|nr:NET1-associated nuclear protein 1 [Saxophila tyrrhenica]
MSNLNSPSMGPGKKRKHEDTQNGASPPKRSRTDESNGPQEIQHSRDATSPHEKPRKKRASKQQKKEKRVREEQRRREVEEERMRAEQLQVEALGDPDPLVAENLAALPCSGADRPKHKNDRKKPKHAERQRAVSKSDDAEQAQTAGATQDHDEEILPPNDSESGKKAIRKARKEAKKQAKSAAALEVRSTHASTAAQRSTGTDDSHGATHQSGPTWMLSPSSAGGFINQDPVFATDDDGETFLISVTARDVQVLSLETSLAVRTYPAPVGQTIRCFTVLEDVVYITLKDATVLSWRWTGENEASPVRNTKSKIVAMASTLQGDEEAIPNLFYICRESKTENAILSDEQMLHTTAHHLHSIHILGNGMYVLAQSPTALVIGARSMDPKTPHDFAWIELPLEIKSSCVDARVSSVPASVKKASNKRPALQVAVGQCDGKIHIYDDLAPLFYRNEQHGLPSPRVLHWHRRAVSSLKFSTDGNYLITGGKETVLVIWQLETGKQQFLPHLTSEIERIAVNSASDRYAVQMGDNSIMVLNTSELKPVANFAGLQMLRTSGRTTTRLPGFPAATIHPRLPNQLLLSVPASQPKSKGEAVTRPFLQGFDIRSSRHITRQALTRNNVTDLSIGPEGRPIIPPDVKHIAISYDGSWLATIDEWTPPMSDLESFGSSRGDIKEQRTSRQEVYLKFWRWDDVQGLWTLTTRVDAPHARGPGHVAGAGRLHALVADPASNAFATVGKDECVRLWRPKTRTRHGVAVKNEANVDLVEWTCKRTIQLESGEERADSPLAFARAKKTSTACLAYAPDGSMLAAAQETGDDSSTPLVHFIDTAGGEVSTSIGLAAADIVALGFLDRYLIVTTRPAVYVWDLVADKLMYRLSLKPPHPEAKAPMLAVSERDGTFAIVSPDTKKTTKVQVFSPQSSECLDEHLFLRHLEAILAGQGAKGYTLLFPDATIRTLSPVSTGHVRTLSSAPAASIPQQGATAIEAAPAQEDTDMVDLVGSVQPAADSAEAPFVAEEREDDRPVVRPEQLADIFDSGSGALPPVLDMFRAVVGLYGRKPEVRPSVEVVV